MPKFLEGTCFFAVDGAFVLLPLMVPFLIHLSVGLAGYLAPWSFGGLPGPPLVGSFALGILSPSWCFLFFCSYMYTCM